MAELLPYGSKFQQAVACELDKKGLLAPELQSVKAAQEAYEAKLRAEAAAKALKCAQIVRDMDGIAFNQREIDICESTVLSSDHVQANIYFASWSKMKERHYQERLATGSSEAVTLHTEREFVTRLAGDALLRWQWLGRTDWCRLPRQASDRRTDAEIMSEIMSARSSMMKTINAYYRSQSEFELVGVEFILRSPSFNLADPGLNDFLRELIDGATIVLKLKLRLRGYIAGAVAKWMGHDSLPSRALAVGGFKTLGDAAAVAFWKVLPVGTIRHLCSFLPHSGNIASSLRDLAKYHDNRALHDIQEAENILVRREKKPRLT